MSCFGRLELMYFFLNYTGKHIILKAEKARKTSLIGEKMLEL